MIAVINYGLGNLYSLSQSLTAIGAEHIVTGEPKDIESADKLILPGVGAFRDAIGQLKKTGLDSLIKQRAKEGVPLMGICLGMQLLFDRSYEYGEYEGLGLIPGDICPIEADITQALKVPHIGWNALKFHRAGQLSKYIREGDAVYYVHSYYAKSLGQSLVASSEYEIDIPGIVENSHVVGTQFHPEKSGNVGLNILRAFCEKEDGQA